MAHDEERAAERPPSTPTRAADQVGEQLQLSSEHQLHRGLKSRHIQFLALGGAIGTGLFVGSGSILSLVGPAPLLMGYLCMILVVWVVMNDLAEMVTYLPLKGISIPLLVDRFVEPSLAWAVGINYFYAYSILVAAEATVGAIVMDYWKTSVPVEVWIALILGVILFLNIVAVSFFGEAEFWFASIKLITIIGLIILSVCIFFGAGPDQGRLGFRYWEDKNGLGAFKPYLVGGRTGYFLAFWTAFVRAGFAFITSPELIAMAAGETVAPRRNIPKAARRFVWRLAIFYGLGSLSIGVIVPSNDVRLLSPKSDAAASPFVIGIQRAGIPVLNHIINAAILTSAWSAGNAFVYSGSRVLYSMAVSGQAPSLFRRTTRRGVPYAAVLATWGFGCLAFLNVSNSGAKVFQWFSNISTISGFIAWIVVMITYLRFRQAMHFRGQLESLPYRTPLQPYATWIALIIMIILTATNGFNVFFPAQWNAADFLAAYITLPIFLVLYVGHKVYRACGRAGETGTCGEGDGGEKESTAVAVWRWAREIGRVDVVTGKKEMDELEAMDSPPVARNAVERIWLWLA